MEKEIVNPVQEAQRVTYTHKRKEKHAKTHTDQTNKDYTQRKNIKSSRGETASNIQGKAIGLAADPSAETLQARREW